MIGVSKAKVNALTTNRRIVALVFPQLLLELAQENAPNGELSRHTAIAVVCENDCTSPVSPQQASLGLTTEQEITTESLPRIDSKTHIRAVNEFAARRGVKTQQTIAEARGRIAQLTVRVVSVARVQKSLETIAESISRFGIRVAIDGLDTIWLDITGVAHLMGGEAVLLEDICSTIASFGHRVNACCAWGPFFSRALARYANRRTSSKKPVRLLASTERLEQYLQWLPLTALPLTDKECQWFVKLGLFSCADLLKVESKALSTRLGQASVKILSLLHGEDNEPLCVYTPQEQIKEEQLWEDAATGVEPLLFVARGLCTRLSARLEGRGLASQSLRVTVMYDKGIARFHGQEEVLSFELELAVPIHRAEELFRIVAARLNKIELNAPCVGLALELVLLTEAHQEQTNLNVAISLLNSADEQSVGLLMTELCLELGEENVGFLTLKDTHLPEQKSQLTRQRPKPQAKSWGVIKRCATNFLRTPKQERLALPIEPEQPTRMFRVAQKVKTAFRRGQFLSLCGQLYEIQAVGFYCRFHTLEWWSERETSRDYVRLGLRSGEVHVDALGFRDRRTGERYLQGLFD